MKKIKCNTFRNSLELSIIIVLSLGTLLPGVVVTSLCFTRISLRWGLDCMILQKYVPGISLLASFTDNNKEVVCIITLIMSLSDALVFIRDLFNPVSVG